MQRFTCCLLLALFLFSTGALSLDRKCSRIVSLAPSITEVLYEVGLGKNIVGVTKFDRYPESVKNKPKVGGLHDPNIEAIAKLKPSTIMLFAETRGIEKLKKLSNVNFYIVNHKNLNNIIKSIPSVSEYCGATEKGPAVFSKTIDRILALENKTKNLPKTKVLIAVGRSGKLKAFNNLFISGNDGFYTSILERLGAENAYKQNTASVASMSMEGLLKLQPDVIIELITSENNSLEFKESIFDSWKDYTFLNAVNRGRVHIIANDYSFIPGPRVIKLMEDLLYILHPELNEK